MDEVIKILIDADKSARARVKESKKLSAKAIRTLEKIKLEQEQANEKIFDDTIAQLKKKYDTLLKEKQNEIDSQSKVAIDLLDAKFEENRSDWVNLIFQKAVEH